MIGIEICALEGLDLVRVCQDSVRQVKALALICQCDPLVCGVEPILSRQIIEALENLHSDTVSRRGSSVQTESSAGKNDLGSTGGYIPVLCRGPVTIKYLDRGLIGEQTTPYIQALGGIPVRVNLECERWSRGRDRSAGRDYRCNRDRNLTGGRMDDPARGADASCNCNWYGLTRDRITR